MGNIHMHYIWHIIIALVMWKSTLTHWGRDNMAAIFPTTFSNGIFLNGDACILTKIPLKFIPKDPINNIPSLVQIMAWRRTGDKPLCEPMVVN